MKNKPIRCFDGNGKPFEPFWAFRDAAETESGETEIEFYGPISEFSWWGDEITPKMFKEQLYANGKDGPVTVRLNSPGGDLIAASVMRNDDRLPGSHHSQDRWSGCQRGGDGGAGWRCDQDPGLSLHDDP